MWLELLGLAWRSLVSNRLRSLLTMLGVIIGVATVIALVGVGQGARSQVLQQLQSLGTNLILVTPGGRVSFTTADATMLQTRVPTIARIAPVVTTHGTVSADRTTLTTTIQGVAPNFGTVRAWQAAEGRFISTWDNETRARVAVLGSKAAASLFPGVDPLGHSVFISGQSFTVVGVLTPKGTSLNVDNDQLILVPLATEQQLLGTYQVSALYVQAQTAQSAPLTAAQISRIYLARWNDPHAVAVNSQDQLISTNNQAGQTLTWLLASVAGVSLLVGGIGIMNIMLVSVTERTREIGLRKAVGATPSEILLQFVIEAVLLALVGGSLGVILGVTLARVLSLLGGWTTTVSVTAVLAAFLFAAATGVLFGVWPARRASRLEPIAALRSE